MKKSLFSRKPKTRKDRIEWMSKKYGYNFVCGFLNYTDKEVKDLFEAIYAENQDKPDYQSEPILLICNYCNKEIEVHHYCGCGENKSSLEV